MEIPLLLFPFSMIKESNNAFANFDYVNPFYFLNFFKFTLNSIFCFQKIFPMIQHFYDLFSSRSKAIFPFSTIKNSPYLDYFQNEFVRSMHPF